MEPAVTTIHPKTLATPTPLVLRHPHSATPLEAWNDPKALVTVPAGSSIPEGVNLIPFAPWEGAPTTEEGWTRLAENYPFNEPPFDPGTKKASAGAAIIEPDGRVWLFSPSNQFGGYRTTFPKGRLDGLSLKAAALKEVFEETGLRIDLIEFLIDADRDTSRSRYYLARRTGGSPAEMGWESQAVHLVPRDQLARLLHHPNDRPVLDALLAHLDKQGKP